MKRGLLYLMALVGIFASCLFVGGISYGQEDLMAETPEDIGISFGSGCLTGMGKGCFSYDKLIRGKESDAYKRNQNRTVTDIASDVILTATYMVGTVLTVILLYCGVMYIFAARGGKDPRQYKDGLVRAAIGAVLVRGAYAIVRLIQYIAKG